MGVKSDIEIAQEANMLNIADVAAKIGVTPDELEMYGKYKAKLSDERLKKCDNMEDGKLILVTAINPTPTGEGKTTISIGLTEALCKMGKKAISALREPSLGPCFGIKGGAAGGGYAQVVPMEDLNLHFTGDFHAITSANNLLAAMLDNHIHQGNDLRIDTAQSYFNEEEVGNAIEKSGVPREEIFLTTKVWLEHYGYEEAKKSYVRIYL